jgi:hypothetical protein
LDIATEKLVITEKIATNSREDSALY